MGIRLSLLAASALFLTGCHADVTFRFDVHGNGTAFATTREILDDQLYELALSQNTNGDPFGAERLERQGWDVSRASDENGNHIITISKLLSRDYLNSMKGATPDMHPGSPPFTSVELTRSQGLFSEQDSLSAKIPALLPFALSQINRPFAGLASAMLGSILTIHLELRTPGKILATNGETTPNGFVRWDLSLQAPTKLLYNVRMIHYDRILVAILIALAAVLLIIRSRRGRFAQRVC